MTNEFISRWNEIAADIHKTCREKGFWEDRDYVKEDMAARNDDNRGKQFVIMEALMLITTELAEAAEGVRHDNPPDDKIPEFSTLEAELADAVIRIMDLGAGYSLDIAGAIVAKSAMNKTRPYKHGKHL